MSTSAATATAVQQVLQRYKDLQDIIAILGIDELTDEDKAEAKDEEQEVEEPEAEEADEPSEDRETEPTPA